MRSHEFSVVRRFLFIFTYSGPLLNAKRWISTRGSQPRPLLRSLTPWILKKLSNAIVMPQFLGTIDVMYFPAPRYCLELSMLKTSKLYKPLKAGGELSTKLPPGRLVELRYVHENINTEATKTLTAGQF